MSIGEQEMKELLENQRKLMAQNAEILEENKKLREEGGAPMRRTLKCVTEHKVRIRMVDDKVVIGFKNRGVEGKPVYVYDIQDPQDLKKRILYVDLVLEGQKEPMPVAYKEFMEQAEEVKCKVISKEEKEWTIRQGWTKKKEVDGYSTVELDFDVPMEVVGKIRTYMIALPADKGGREITVHEDFINL